MSESKGNVKKREDPELISLSDTSSEYDEEENITRKSSSKKSKSALEFAESAIMSDDIVEELSSDTEEDIEVLEPIKKDQNDINESFSITKNITSRPNMRELCAAAAVKRQKQYKDDKENVKTESVNLTKQNIAADHSTTKRSHGVKRSSSIGEQPAKKQHIDYKNEKLQENLLRSPIRLISNKQYCDEYCKNGNRDTITMTDLVGSKNLVKTYQFNFLIDGTFLFEYVNADPTKLEIILIGHKDEEHMAVKAEHQSKYNIKMIDATKRLGHYGSHHSKMMVNMFEDGTCQIIVHTMNLTVSDYALQTQMCWMSPILHKCADEERAERYQKYELDSKKDVGDIFKKDLFAYLSTYELPETDALIKELAPFDFQYIDVQFIASSPGNYDLITEQMGSPREYGGDEADMFGFGKLYDYLKVYDLTCLYGQFIGQASSIASPFDGKKSNIFTHLLTSIIMGYGRLVLRPQKTFDLKDSSVYPMIIWPTAGEVVNAKGSVLSGYALHYRNQRWRSYRGHEIQDRQLRKYFCRWSSVNDSQQSKAGRSRLMPHCKTYCVTEDGFHTLKWFLMTSANISTQAWGKPEVSKDYFKAYKYTLCERLKFNIASYEAGILVNPKTLRTNSRDSGKRVVLVPALGQDTVPQERRKHKYSDKEILYPVRLPYDIPLAKYRNEQPWNTGILEKTNDGW